MLSTENLELLALCLILLGTGILYVALPTQPEQAFGKIDADKAIITGYIDEEIQTENGWIYPMEACQEITVWSESQKNSSGIVEIEGSMNDGMFFARSIKPK